MEILTCENLSFEYENEIVLKDVNFSIEEGSYLSIIGENGSGKSTLVKGLVNLKGPLQGSINYHKSINRKEIGYLSQQTNIQKDFPANVYEVVLSGCLNKLGFKPFYTNKEKKLANENIKRLNIENIKFKSFQDLSGGQKQRVLLARALCASDKILILDEPLAGLDPLVSNDFYELLSNINKTLKLTIIMVSHDIKCLKYSSHILLLNRTQTFFGTSEDFLSSDLGKDYFSHDKFN